MEQQTALLIVYTYTSLSCRQEEMNLHKWNNIQNAAWCCNCINSIWLVRKWQVKTRVKNTRHDPPHPHPKVLLLSHWMPVWQSPIPPVTRRAAVTLTTTVIEQQPLTVPPACFLLGSTIKQWWSALLTLFLCCLEEADVAVRDSWIQRNFLLVCFASLSFWG